MPSPEELMKERKRIETEKEAKKEAQKPSSLLSKLKGWWYA